MGRGKVDEKKRQKLKIEEQDKRNGKREEGNIKKKRKCRAGKEENRKQNSLEEIENWENL